MRVCLNIVAFLGGLNIRHKINYITSSKCMGKELAVDFTGTLKFPVEYVLEDFLWPDHVSPNRTGNTCVVDELTSGRFIAGIESTSHKRWSLSLIHILPS